LISVSLFHYVKYNSKVSFHCFYFSVKKSNIWSEAANLLYVLLFLLNWGEATNLRFVPECICFLGSLMNSLMKLLKGGRRFWTFAWG